MCSEVVELVVRIYARYDDFGSYTSKLGGHRNFNARFDAGIALVCLTFCVNKLVMGYQIVDHTNPTQ